ncbi:MAG TPA: type 2 lanthipeptide synthetase LanM [Vicinamibacterales bacterium]
MTHDQRRRLRQIAGRATPLWERTPARSGAVDSRRLERWCDVLGSRDLLDRRMRSARGLAPESLLGARKPARVPGWVRTLAAVLAAPPSRSTDASNDVPFGDILEPFLAHARLRFESRAKGSRDVLSPAALAAIERQLLEHLSLVAGLALGRLFYEFRFARAPLSALEDAWSRRPRSTRIYAQFAARLSGGDLMDAFDRYPVLARLLAQSVELWIAESARLCERIATDWERLRSFIELGQGRGVHAVTAIGTGLSDRHAGGQTVARLTFATGERVVYKPRSVRPEIAFNAFLGWLNARGLPLQLKTVRALDRGSYGWMEVVDHRRCDDEAAVARFFARAGMLLAVLHALAVTDIHCENLVAAGEHPVVVDLETLLSGPRHRASVLDTGLLPRRASGRESALDASALGAPEIPDSDLRFPVWHYVNTDQMMFSEGVPRERQLHRVQIGERRPSASAYLRQFKDGFRAAYDCLLANRRELLADPFLEKFDRLNLRVLLRDSSTYGRLHLHLLHPEFLEDGADRSIEIEWLARPLCIRNGVSRGRVRVYEHERQAMERLDLPHFDTLTWRRMAHAASTQEARTFGGRRDARALRRRLEGLSQKDCRNQLALITRSLGEAR